MARFTFDAVKGAGLDGAITGGLYVFLLKDGNFIAGEWVENEHSLLFKANALRRYYREADDCWYARFDGVAFEDLPLEMIEQLGIIN